jgi:large subunit ribosomal protein L29
MTAMNAKDMREMPNEDLLHHLETVRKDLFGLRFQNATGELENTAQLRAKKRELARVLTVANERDLDTDHIAVEI